MVWENLSIHFVLSLFSCLSTKEILVLNLTTVTMFGTLPLSDNRAGTPVVLNLLVLGAHRSYFRVAYWN